MTNVKMKAEATIEVKKWGKNLLIKEHMRYNPDGSVIDILKTGEKWRCKQIKVLRG